MDSGYWVFTIYINGEPLSVVEDKTIGEAGEFALGAGCVAGGEIKAYFDNLVITTFDPTTRGSADLTAVVTAQLLPAYAKPNSTGVAIYYLAVNEVIKVIGRDATCTWLQIQTPKWQGWVFNQKQTLTLNGNCRDLPVNA